MNTFGSSQLQFALCDGRSVRSDRGRFRRGALPLLGRVNHFYIPTGRWPFRGWVLLPRYEYAQLNSYSTDLQLSVGDVVLKNLSVVQARCVTRGLAADRNALYLVELTDDRGVLANQWFQAPLTTQYNVRAPAYPGVFHPQSLNAGAPWTWATMLQDMWVKTATANLLGSWPGLPTAPSGTPEGFWFQGAPAWRSIVDTLEHLGLKLVANLTVSTSPYTIVQDGASDAAFTALQAKYADRLEDDLEWVDTGAARVPGAVLVLFRKRYSVYGTEETVRYDSPQWGMTPYYSVSVAAPAQFSGAVGLHYLQSDFTVRYDQDGSPLAEDTAAAAAIAAERATQYYNSIYGDTVGFMTQTYAGALPFKTGSQVDGVCYYMDDGGWRTQLVRGPSPPWEGLWERST